MTTPWKELAFAAKSWPFEEARRIVERIKGVVPAKGYVLFETGYGPSGLPHLGTFGEVVRTTMVRRAFEVLTEGAIPTRLFCISDDMDGLRKVPENLPNAGVIEANLGKPLTQVPDPFGTHGSFGHHMNARLCAFLDRFGFEYEFKSATELYTSGAFDAALLTALRNYGAIMKIMLPTLGEERRATYSPFLPISPKSGRVLYVPTTPHPEKGTVTFRDEDGSETELPVTGGHCKLQWKPDFGMRWAALDVDFEMYGKDHLVNGQVYSAICRALGGNPPVQFNYELFLDEKGEKISKSKGNGIGIDAWLSYAPTESLALYMFTAPRKAKRLYFDVIPQQVDDYATHLSKFAAQAPALQLDNPVWHIHRGRPPVPESHGLTFGLLLNLASACNPEDKSVLWGFIARYVPGATPAQFPALDALADFAVRYYHDFVKPAKAFRPPTEQERTALADLARYLRHTQDTDADALQTEIFEIGKRHGYENLRLWFGCMYEVLLGQSSGPRMGSFVALYGKAETAALIDRALEGANHAG